MDIYVQEFFFMSLAHVLALKRSWKESDESHTYIKWEDKNVLQLIDRLIKPLYQRDDVKVPLHLKRINTTIQYIKKKFDKDGEEYVELDYLLCVFVDEFRKAKREN